MGTVRHVVLLAVLGEQSPRQVGVRERLREPEAASTPASMGSAVRDPLASHGMHLLCQIVQPVCSAVV
ncbi:hypothetical protein [Streptomyces sp. NPDC059165]